MADERPFASLEELFGKAESVWWSLEPQDWLEAFHSHPRIGERRAAQPMPVDALAWAEEEQSGARNADRDTLHSLSEMNRKYEEKFGYIYIVCATGKSSEEMLEILRARLNNSPENEGRIAATEQSRITQLRLKKLLDQ
jgi:OHCU decarboxylase